MNAKEQQNPPGNPKILEIGTATRFTPGRSGNPGGRPRNKPYTDAYLKVADLSVAELQSLPDDSVAVGIAKAMARAALEGKISAAVECANRAEGTPRQTVGIEEQDAVGPRLSVEETVAKFRQIFGLTDPDARDEAAENGDTAMISPPLAEG